MKKLSIKNIRLFIVKQLATNHISRNEFNKFKMKLSKINQIELLNMLQLSVRF